MAISATEQLEQHKKRLEQLSARRNTIQVKLESARQQYAEAVREAQENYGTSDLDSLRNMLREQEAANSQAVAEFVAAVDEFEKLIVRIEDALANPVAMAQLVASMEPVTSVAKPAPTPAAPLSFNDGDI